MGPLEMVPFTEAALGVGLGFGVLAYALAAGTPLVWVRFWLAPTSIVVQSFLGLVLANRLGLEPIPAVLTTVGIVAALTGRQRLTTSCFVVASLWVGVWWACAVLAMTGVAFAGIVVADRFDRKLPAWLLAISASSAGLALPDVELPMLLAAMFATVAVGAFFVRLGPATLASAIPMVAWGFAFAAQGRPASIIGGVGALGVLVVVPIVTLLVPSSLSPRGTWVWLIPHSVGGMVLARHAGLLVTWERPLVVSATGFAALAAALVLGEMARGRRGQPATVAVELGA